MNAQQARRLYNVVFVAVALIVLLAGFRRACEYVEDTVGEHLRGRHREEMGRIECEIYNRILADEGLAAATKYMRIPKAWMSTGTLKFYEDHQSALVVFSLTVLLVLTYFLVWFGLTRLYRYILYGGKGEQGAPPNGGPAPPVGNSGVTEGRHR